MNKSAKNFLKVFSTFALIALVYALLTNSGVINNTLKMIVVTFFESLLTLLVVAIAIIVLFELFKRFIK